MKRIGEALRKFFFPPAGAPLWVKVLPYAVLGVLSLALLVGGAYGWEYTNSPEFCGTSCHTMPPEYSSYLISPHARIACVECHIGRDFIATQITRKAGDLRHVVFTLFQTYEYPIYAKAMRPARDTCERCHFPEKFSDDSMRQLVSYSNDLRNTPISTYLTLKTGGATKLLGEGRGIHWHIGSRVLYYPTDRTEQEIPYVRVYEEDGTYTEYYDLESDFDPAEVNEEDLKEMDCITCHNRITHLVNPPDKAVDLAIERELINDSIPEIRSLGVKMLSAPYTQEGEALNAIAGLKAYYQTYYQSYYNVHTEQIDQAIAVLTDIYTQSVHLEQRSDWFTHPNNIGHKYSPGCFRCHDGKHLNNEQDAVRLECNLCHSIPVVAGPYDFIANIEVSRGPEPQSHHNTNWIVMHREAFNSTCANCHTTGNPGGTDNTSFCSNSACHGSSWDYAGFDAPALRPIILASLPPTPTPQPMGEGPLTYDGSIRALFSTRCGACHGDNPTAGLNLTNYASAMAGSSSGAVIIAGDANASKLMQVQTADQPHFGQFTPEELQVIIDWINAGAPEN
jgi:nitrate/TMAO reductase-like tetraheme cytochrome c subunit/mono/diheme cytochrome c family protein